MKTQEYRHVWLGKNSSLELTFCCRLLQKLSVCHSVIAQLNPQGKCCQISCSLSRTHAKIHSQRAWNTELLYLFPPGQSVLTILPGIPMATWLLASTGDTVTKHASNLWYYKNLYLNYHHVVSSSSSLPLLSPLLVSNMSCSFLQTGGDEDKPWREEGELECKQCACHNCLILVSKAGGFLLPAIAYCS